MTLYTFTSVYFIVEHSFLRYTIKRKSEEYLIDCETKKSIHPLKYSIDPRYHFQTRFSNIIQWCNPKVIETKRDEKGMEEKETEREETTVHLIWI